MRTAGRNPGQIYSEVHMIYQNIIHEMDPTVNPAGVEASMRLQYGTLDHLGTEEFRDEIEMAKMLEVFDPGTLRAFADSYGLEVGYDEWDRKLACRKSS